MIILSAQLITRKNFLTVSRLTSTLEFVVQIVAIDLQRWSVVVYTCQNPSLEQIKNLPPCYMSSSAEKWRALSQAKHNIKSMHARTQCHQHNRGRAEGQQRRIDAPKTTLNSPLCWLRASETTLLLVLELLKSNTVRDSANRTSSGISTIVAFSYHIMLHGSFGCLYLSQLNGVYSRSQLSSLSMSIWGSLSAKRDPVSRPCLPA